MVKEKQWKKMEDGMPEEFNLKCQFAEREREEERGSERRNHSRCENKQNRNRKGR